jgi:hypothetical protein
MAFFPSAAILDATSAQNNNNFALFAALQWRGWIT